MYSTRMLTIGGLVAMREYARLIGDNARSRLGMPSGSLDKRRSPSGPNSPELAFYDCQACHHELAVDSWRQKRGHLGRPGRPAVRAWPIALGKVGAAAYGQRGAALRQSLQEFYRAVDKQPFGDPRHLSAAAAHLVDSADAAIHLMLGQRFDEGRGAAILQEICAAGTTELPDFETARQLGWAMQVTYGELPQKYHDKEIDDTIETISRELSLAIPTREEEVSSTSATGPDDCVCVANKSVPQTLAAAAKYDPLAFRDHCRKMAKLLAARTPAAPR
jgi:hypothetical protein